MAVATTDDHVGERVRICHTAGRVVRANDHSYAVVLELAGIDQEVLASPDYIHGQVEEVED